jgi:hypothetical protein
MKAIKNKSRLWFVLSLSKFQEEKFPKQQKILLNYLDQVAQKIDVVQGKDFFICLYDFRK